MRGKGRRCTMAGWEAAGGDTGVRKTHTLTALGLGRALKVSLLLADTQPELIVGLLLQGRGGGAESRGYRRGRKTGERRKSGYAMGP